MQRNCCNGLCFSHVFQVDKAKAWLVGILGMLTLRMYAKVPFLQITSTHFYFWTLCVPAPHDVNTMFTPGPR